MPKESLAEFMARKSDPKWKPKPLPRFKKLPKLPDHKFAALLAQHSGSGLVRVDHALAA